MASNFDTKEMSNILFFSSDEISDSKSNRYHVAHYLSKKFKVIYVLRQNLSILSAFKRPSRFVNSFVWWGRVICSSENLIYVTPPLVFPGKSYVIKTVNTFLLVRFVRKVLKKNDINNYITWTVTPFQSELLNYFPGRFSVYHCHDGYSYYPKAKRQEVIRKEYKLKKNVDLIFYASKFLFDESGFHEKSFYIGHGFDEIFLKCDNCQTPEDIGAVPKPIVGFHGVLNFHTDVKLLEFLVNRHRDVSFVFVGPVYSKEASRLKSFKNFYFLGQKEFGDLPCYLNHFDIAILPYKKIPMTNACSPLKLYEYLACGMPIVSTDIPEVHVHNGYIHVATKYKQFSELIVEYLSLSHDRTRQQEYAKRHLWPKKIDFVINTIRQKYSEKQY